MTSKLLNDPEFTSLFEQLVAFKKRVHTQGTTPEDVIKNMRTIHGKIILRAKPIMLSASTDEDFRKVALLEQMICICAIIISKCEKHLTSELIQDGCNPMERLLRLLDIDKKYVSDPVHEILSIKKSFIQSGDFSNPQKCIEMRTHLGKFMESYAKWWREALNPTAFHMAGEEKQKKYEFGASLMCSIIWHLNEKIRYCEKMVMWERIESRIPDLFKKLYGTSMQNGGNGNGGNHRGFGFLVYLLDDKDLSEHFGELTRLKHSGLMSIETSNAMLVAFGKLIHCSCRHLWDHLEKNETSNDVFYRKVGYSIGLKFVASEIVYWYNKHLMWKLIREKMGVSFFDTILGDYLKSMAGEEEHIGMEDVDQSISSIPSVQAPLSSRVASIQAPLSSRVASVQAPMVSNATLSANKSVNKQSNLDSISETLEHTIQNLLGTQTTPTAPSGSKSQSGGKKSSRRMYAY